MHFTLPSSGFKKGGYKYTLKPKEKAKVISGICIIQWLGSTFSGHKHSGPINLSAEGHLGRPVHSELLLGGYTVGECGKIENEGMRGSKISFIHLCGKLMEVKP